MSDKISGVVGHGQGIAGGWLATRPDVYKPILGSYFPASLNVRIDRNTTTWDWQVGPEKFNNDSRIQVCKVNGVVGHILYIENACQSYGEGKNRTNYPDKSMLEIVCVEEILGVTYGSVILLETDLDAI